MSHMLTWNEIFPELQHKIRLPKSLLPFISDRPLSENDAEFARKLHEAKKVELHVHMEAAVSEKLYERLNVGRKLYEPHYMPAMRAPFASLDEFIKAWIDNTRLIDEESLYAEVAIDFVANRAAQNIVYSEVHVSPVDFSIMRKRFGFAEPLSLQKCAEAILTGLKKAETLYPKVAVRLIVDCLWVTTWEERQQFFQLFDTLCDSPLNRDAFGEKFIVAVGMGGPERNLDEANNKIFVSEIRARNLKIDVHSGENTSADTHRRNVEDIVPDRIGHGISGWKEGWSFEGHIAMCPLSNLLTGSFSGGLNEHPVGEMFRKHGNISINSDDPLLFGNSLVLEYVALKNAFGLHEDFFYKTQEAARNAVFDKKTLRRVLV